MTLTESAIQQAFVDWCAVALPPEVLWLAIPNEAVRTPRMGARMKAQGLRPGAADFMLVHQGKAHFIEFKTAKGRMSIAQNQFGYDALNAGAEYAMCRSVDEAVSAVTAWGIPCRETGG